jgi:RNA polymerase sigma factor (sigma-70 family)
MQLIVGVSRQDKPGIGRVLAEKAALTLQLTHVHSHGFLVASRILMERILPSRQYLLVDGSQAAQGIAAPADFEAAFREHFAPVHRFIARRVGKALAEDLAAEVFATAYRRRAAYHPERGSLRSWLYGIATNVVREHWRDEQQLLELDARVARACTGPLSAARFSDAADERATAATLAPRIAGALAALTNEQREVLLLHAWADLRHDEIAAALGIAQGTARSRLSRARAALRAQLGEFDFDQWTFRERHHV